MTCTQHSQALSQVAFPVQLAQVENLAAIAELIALSFYPPGHWLYWFRWVLQLGIYNDLYLRYHHPREQCIYLMVVVPAQNTLKLVGSLEVSQRCLPGRATSHAYLSNLAVHPNYRRQGIGRALLLAAEDWLTAQKSDRVYLHVLETNDPARCLYQQLGYHPESRNSPLFSPDTILLTKCLNWSLRC